MCEFVKVDMTTKEFDEYEGKLLESYGAKPAPNTTYNFSDLPCISLNEEVAHGIP